MYIAKAKFTFDKGQKNLIVSSYFNNGTEERNDPEGVQEISGNSNEVGGSSVTFLTLRNNGQIINLDPTGYPETPVAPIVFVQAYSADDKLIFPYVSSVQHMKLPDNYPRYFSSVNIIILFRNLAGDLANPTSFVVDLSLDSKLK